MTEKSNLYGTVQSVLIGNISGSLVTTPVEKVQVNFAGFEGDQHAGLTRKSDGRTPYYPRGTVIRNDRQVSLVSVDELAQIAAGLNVPELQPAWLGANLLLSGMPRLTRLPPNTRLVFQQGAVLVVQAENLPCTGPGEVLAAQFRQPELKNLFPKFALGRRGLVACVEKPGSIAAGDTVQVEVPTQTLYDPAF